MGKRNFIICSILIISLPCPFHSLADYNGPGWYRIQNSALRVDVNGNNATNRFISIIHNEGSVGMTGDIDGHAVFLVSAGNEISDPSTLLYVSGSLSAANFQALGTSIKNITGYTLKLTEKGSGTFGKLYNASVEINLFITTVKVLLQDAYEGTPKTTGIDKADGSGSAVNSADCQWFIRPVDVGDGGDTYFGVAPTEDDKIGDYYYTTLRTAFSYKLSTNVDAFIIDSNGVLTQLPHSDVVPINTPVILRCQSTDPSDNRLYPQVVGTKVFSSETSSVTSNLVKGTTYSYFKSSIVNAKEGNNGSYTRGTEYAFGTAYNDNIRVLSVENGKLGFFKTFHEAYPSDLCLNGQLAYYNLKAANSDANGGLTLLETPSLAPSTAETLVGGTISFTASKLSPKGGTLQYRIDDGDWIDVTGTSVSFNVTSDVPKSGKVYARTINCGCPSNVVEATYTFTQPAPTYQPITLAELVTKPVDGTKYEITDLTAVAFVDDDQLLVCKDNNAYVDKDEIQTGWYDYINTSSGFNFTDVTTGDQSNWIALRLTSPKSAELLLKKLTNVKGTLVNIVNPEFQLDGDLTYSTSDEVALNTYVAASFSGENHQQGNNGRTYFFVQPKRMEYAQIDWAQWDGEKFIAPVHDADHQNWNQAELVGQFDFNGSYLEKQSEMNDLMQNHVYMMTGVIKLNEVPRRAAAASASKYVVFPTNLTKTTKVEGGIITGVNNVAGVSDVAGVEYVNLAGQRSSRPWSGVNIIVTRYTDGSFTTSRIILN